MAQTDNALLREIAKNTSGGLSGGGSGDTSSLAQEETLAELRDRLPPLNGGRIPVDVESLTITVGNTQLEIVNDVGNPIPVNGTIAVSNFPSSTEIANDVGNPVPVSGTVEIANDTGNPIPVNGTIAFSNTSINIGNFPTSTEIANDSGNPIPITATSLPLMTGAATNASVVEVRDRLPATLGAKTAANSLPVTLSTDGAFSTNFGAQADAAATTDAGPASLISLFKRLLGKFQTGAQTIANSVSVAIATDQSVHVIGSTVSVSAEFTRPADINAYAIDDVVSNSTTATVPLTFPNAARIVNGTGYIVSARMAKSSATTTNASFRLWLYREIPTTPPGDNTPFALLWANRARRLGFIDFTLTTAGTGSNSASASVTDFSFPFFTVGSRDLYGLLIARGAYAPASGEQFFVEIGLELN